MYFSVTIKNIITDAVITYDAIHAYNHDIAIGYALAQAEMDGHDLNELRVTGYRCDMDTYDYKPRKFM